MPVESKSVATPKPGGPAGPGLKVLLVITLVALAWVAYLALRRSDPGVEYIVAETTAENPAAVPLNVGQVIDAVDQRDVTAVEGGRYRVRIDDRAREGAAGVARIGGLVTFVPDTEPGDEVVVEVTRLQRRTADAVVLQRFPPAPVPDDEKTEAHAPRDDMPVNVGEEYWVDVTERDRRNPDRNGVARINGLVVFVPGTQPGDRVRIRITELQARSARAEVLE